MSLHHLNAGTNYRGNFKTGRKSDKPSVSSRPKFKENNLYAYYCKEYEEARNALIPEAERYANEIHGVVCKDGRDWEVTAWNIAWTKTFIKRMDELVAERGVNSIGIPHSDKDQGNIC